MSITTTQAQAHAAQLLSRDVDTISWHNLAAVGEVISKLATSKRAANQALAEQVRQALLAHITLCGLVGHADALAAQDLPAAGEVIAWTARATSEPSNAVHAWRQDYWETHLLHQLAHSKAGQVTA